MKKALLVCMGALGSTTGVVVTLAALKPDKRDDRDIHAPAATFNLEAAQTFKDFALFAPGRAAIGLPLTSLARRDVRHRGQPARASYVTFKYGTCIPGPDAGCPAPLEVQVWPACERTRADYQLTPDPDGAGPKHAVPLPRKDLWVRGVPASFFEGGARLELYTGDVTVVLFGSSSAQLLRAAQSIRGINRPLARDSPLPPPVPGALSGRLPCH